MAILVPEPPAKRGSQAKGEWEAYAEVLRTMLAGELMDSERGLVRFQLRFSEALLEQMRKGQQN